MSQNTPFLVGTEASAEALRQLDWQDMQQRPLNDPAYAGSRADFDWHQYIALQFDDSAFEKEVSATLDQFAQTAEGQQTIRQAYAMQNYRIRSGQTSFAPDQERTLCITDKLLKLKIAFNEEREFEAGFNQGTGIVHLKREKLLAESVLAADGTYKHISLPAALYHELCHAKDGFLTLLQEKRYDEVKNQEIGNAIAEMKFSNRFSELYAELLEKRRSITEYPAIIETNAFMQKYYGETPRALHYIESSRGNSWFNELVGRTTSQPNLPEGIDYNNIPNLPIPNCKPDTCNDRTPQ